MRDEHGSHETGSSIDGHDGLLTPNLAVADRMADAASAWIASLTVDQRQVGVYQSPLEDPLSEQERVTWFYTPTDHGGLPLGAQRPAQQQLAMKLLAAGLTLPGYVAASTIIGLENVLDLIENFEVQWDRERGRDSGLFYVRTFGEPGPSGVWAWRFAGHHLSVNFLIVDRQVVSSSPLFLGADPASVLLPGGSRLSPLGGIEALARRFASTLNSAQRDRMRLLDRPVSDIVSGNRAHLSDGDEMMHMQDLWRGRFDDPKLLKLVDAIDTRAETNSGFTANDHRLMAYRVTPAGLSSDDLDSSQRELLQELVSAAKSNTVATDRARCDRDPLSGLHIAWGGSLEPGKPLYFRLQAPEVLFEYDNTQRDGNHVHTVLRNPKRDFGTDVLANHRNTRRH